MLYRLTDDLLGRAIARRSVLYLAISPLAFIFSTVYAESLFLVLAVGSFLLHRAPAHGLVVRRRARSRCSRGRSGSCSRRRSPGASGATAAGCSDRPSPAAAVARAAAAGGRARVDGLPVVALRRCARHDACRRSAGWGRGPSFPPAAARADVHRRGLAPPHAALRRAPLVRGRSGSGCSSRSGGSAGRSRSSTRSSRRASCCCRSSRARCSRRAGSG